MNKIRILKNSKDMSEYIQSMCLYSCITIKTFNFSTRFTTIPNSKLKLIYIVFHDVWVVLFDNIFVMYDGRVIQQTVGIPMGTNCAPLLANLFLYSYEAVFIRVHGLLKKIEKKLTRCFDFTFRYINSVFN